MSEWAATILVVDDNPNNLKVLDGILGAAGYRVLAARDGEAALRAATAGTPDLVLLDVRMPGMDGYEVCRRLKAMPATQALPVIFISALQETEDKIEAFRTGGVDYITKPFQADEVLSRVRTHVALARSQRELAAANEGLEATVRSRTLDLSQTNARLELSMRHEQALKHLLTLSHQPLALDEYLRRGLQWLADVFGWRPPQRRSAVFLAQQRGQSDRMDLIASIGMPQEQQQRYAQIGFADRVCGMAAEPCCIVLPLVSDGRTLGVLMHTLAGDQPLPDEERRLLEQVADVLTISIARRYADERIAYMVYHDELTDLLNRSSVIERLNDELRRADRHAGGFAVLFIDFDRFKQINDVLGHDAGDRFLKIAAERLTGALRAGDVLCRWGSDEFVVLALDLGDNGERAAADAQAVALKLAETLAAPAAVAGQELQLNASIGIALHPEDGNGAAELMQHAELAMSRAKQAGRNLVHFYQPEMQSEATRRMTLGRELRHAVEARQFVLHFQPQVDSTGCLLGAEALVRWHHPQRGLVSPLEFIPLAEELGLIVALGDFVLADSVRWYSSLPDGRLPTLSVNVSARQFHEEGFAERCLAVLRQAGVAPERIELEVTESLLLADIKGAHRKIATLRDAGFCFAVDDFGTGYSSLAYLKDLPVQKLKIDRSFVQDVHRDERNAAIVHTIVALADNLGMTTIAEGVEQREEVDFLLAAGCASFQGYYFGKPVAAGEFEHAWIAR
jgi:diguanylate cyclase (GGDEF)-like protein